MNTPDMLQSLKDSAVNTEATAPSIDGQPPLRAWICWRDGNACHVQIAQQEQRGETTVFRALTSIPLRDDWELVTP
jgi:hypothetical protein